MGTWGEVCGGDGDGAILTSPCGEKIKGKGKVFFFCKKNRNIKIERLQI